MSELGPGRYSTAAASKGVIIGDMGEEAAKYFADKGAFLQRQVARGEQVVNKVRLIKSYTCIPEK